MNFIAGKVDGILVALREVCIAFFNEAFILLSQFWNGVASVVLSFLHQRDYRVEAQQRIRDDVGLSKSPPTSTTDLTQLLEGASWYGTAPSSPTTPRAADTSGVIAKLMNDGEELPMARERSHSLEAERPKARQRLFAGDVPHTPASMPRVMLRNTGYLTSAAMLVWNAIVTFVSWLKVAGFLLLPRQVQQRWRSQQRTQPATWVLGSGRVSDASTTGLLEDARMATTLAVDGAFGGLRSSVQSASSKGAPATIKAAVKGAWNGMRRGVRAVVHPRQAISSVASAALHAERLGSVVDTRGILDLVTGAGYPYELHTCTTEDGYVLTLDRIPRHDATHAVLFVHGVLDCAFAWIGSGTLHALAYRAHDAGCDVWLANFRGTRACQHLKQEVPMREYWNFNINHHGLSDLPAIIAKLRSVKSSELSEVNCFPAGDDRPTNRFPRTARLQPREEEQTLSVVAHSMGGAATLMYLMTCGMKKIPHYVNKAVLLSPAGVHVKVPRFIKIFGLPAYLISCVVSRWVHAVRFPSEVFRVLIQKLMQDVRNNPSIRDLLSVVVSGTLLGSGTNAQDFAMARLPNLTYNIFAGTSLGVGQHIFQWWWKKRFAAFDYGSKGNMQAYGQKQPIDFSQHYDKIDIPVHFVYGLNDRLITPEDVAVHYRALRKVRPNLAFATAFSMGHVDFTYGMSDELISFVTKQLPRPLKMRARAQSV
eukprot:TRINITY_DN2592_c0_g1_i1.p1 TRINITY_DN2592_c0_g1~~TRINITY_DN2592_c0_g1_i1.p1  ORF type:complete len:707 (-),score=130.69 TRINITY_DN2592_c0_g1_i1:55-2175(-)